MIDSPIIQTKADLLCFGLQPSRATSAIYDQQNPRKGLKTGNVGLHIFLSGESSVLTTVTHGFDKKSPLRIRNDNGTFLLEKNGIILMDVNPIAMPLWYNKCTQNGASMAEIFLHESSCFLHQTYEGCDYQQKGLGCKFCGTGKKWRIGSPRQVAETAAAALKENETYHICLGGGTRIPLSKSIKYFANCLDAIKEYDINAPIWIEMPPPLEDDIEMLVEKGATSFGFNIEIWNDEVREKICPGKAAFSKKRYLAAMRKALALLGANRVGSCLVAGLEEKRETEAGIHALVSEGVQPCLLPFKPWDHSALLEYAPCEPSFLIELSEVAVQGMLKNSIIPKDNQGCLQCEACTLEHDIYKQLA